MAIKATVVVVFLLKNGMMTIDIIITDNALVLTSRSGIVMVVMLRHSLWCHYVVVIIAWYLQKASVLMSLMHQPITVRLFNFGHVMEIPIKCGA